MSPFPLVLKTIDELRAWRTKLGNQTVGFVPTMGALHEGHLSLVRESKSRSDQTIVSIFVNPAQFGPHEDLSRYPRPLDHDLALLAEAQVSAVFCPEVSTMYPAGASTWVAEDRVSAPLCGKFRPGHFRGVTTIVLKLFNLVGPTFAFFGQKDAQQCAVIRKMVKDLDVPIQLIICPTAREPDGLAMSSRNVFLSPEDRARAPRIYQSLLLARGHFLKGEREVTRLKQVTLDHLKRDPGLVVQYLEIVHPDSLETEERVGNEGALLAIAVHLGQTRLIDNLILE